MAVLPPYKQEGVGLHEHMAVFNATPVFKTDYNVCNNSLINLKNSFSLSRTYSSESKDEY